jgi:DNA-binding GntR family transcriptional regulator
VVNPPVASPHAFVDDRQSLADLVYRHLLKLIESGDLKPGQRINDLELAESVGYSRTPVREALQRLRSIGAVETSAQRYTRVVDVSPQQMQNCLVVWVALAHALSREIVDGLDDQDFAILDTYVARFSESRQAGESRATALAAFRFFEHLTSRSVNPELRRAIESVVYIILIGSLELPGWLDTELVESSLRTIVDGLRRRMMSDVDAAFDQLVTLEVDRLAVTD